MTNTDHEALMDHGDPALARAGRAELQGWVVDIACLRKYPEDEYAQRARVHTTACALMGHCVESGYGVVGEGGRIHLLDPEATSKVVAVLEGSDAEQGVYVRAERRLHDGEMVTESVSAAESPW